MWWRRGSGRARLATALSVAAGVSLLTGTPKALEALRDHPYFAVKEIVTRGTGSLLSEEELRAYLNAAGPLGLWRIHPSEIRRRLERLAVVARASVHRKFPDRLEVSVIERRPVALALLAGRLFYVDRDGRAFFAVGLAHGRDYPVITGVGEDLPPPRRRWLLRQALRLIRLSTHTKEVGEVSEVHIGADAGAVFYPRSPAVALVLGWGSWGEKLARAVRVLRVWAGHEENLASLDLRFRGQVVAKTRHRQAAEGAEAQPGTKLAI